MRVGPPFAAFVGGTLPAISTRRLRFLAVITLVAVAGTFTLAEEGDDDSHFHPGNLVVSGTVYHNDPDNVTVGMNLPPNCAPANCVVAKYDGTFPTVFNNAPIDGSFGITSKIFLDQMTTSGHFVNRLWVPHADPATGKDQMVTSFSSKSELALHLSTDGEVLTFMGYKSPIDAIDVSNSNTPGVVDPTNPVPATVYRLVAEVTSKGKFRFTETNAYSGNNGRAAILNNKGAGEGFFYLAGNAGNGGNPQPTGILLAAGAQILTPSDLPEMLQNPGTPTPVGSFNITQLIDLTQLPKLVYNKPDKVGKDDNFRGIQVFNGVLYYTKGSGGNGVNTVYFVDTTGLACPSPANNPTLTAGTGIPAAGVTLPTSPLLYPNPLPPTGLPSNMCVLAGFPTLLAKSAVGVTNPFGLWFANATTLYVVDEGDGFNSDATLYDHAKAQTAAGLQKWVFDSNAKVWKLAYTLQAGLDLGVPYTVKNYPTGPNPGSAHVAGLPWSPATDGLRTLTGRVNGDGTVSIWAVTSTVSGSGDQGADPNKLVKIKDKLSATTLPANEQFVTVRTAGFGEVLRGVSFTPGTGKAHNDQNDQNNQGNQDED
jgi:hypothetical protein